MNNISVIPVGGLCNRMRVIASSVTIAIKIQSEECNIYWNNNEECSANFNDLFLPINIDNVNIIENNSLLHKEPSKSNFQIPRILQKLYYPQIVWGFNSKTDGNIFHKLKPAKNTLLYTCHSMCKHYPLKELFVPCMEIQKVINEVVSAFSEKTYGLHIRRTDHIKAMEQTPLNYFYDLIEEQISKNKDVRFYLATDDEKVKLDLVNKYANRIIVFEGELSRTSKQGMMNAVVDLFALSHTTSIFGSACSSYSELAAEIGGIPLVIKGNETR